MQNFKLTSEGTAKRNSMIQTLNTLNQDFSIVIDFMNMVPTSIIPDRNSSIDFIVIPALNPELPKVKNKTFIKCLENPFLTHSENKVDRNSESWENPEDAGVFIGDENSENKTLITGFTIHLDKIILVTQQSP